MLSYRHAFHAGNHADVFKHALLVMLLERLNAKEAPYTFIDTHAGSARYDLKSERALKTNDAESGILKLLEAGGRPRGTRQNDFTPLPFERTMEEGSQKQSILPEETFFRRFSAGLPSDFNNFQKYLRFVNTCLAKGFYPGSPEIERAFMRPQDSLILSELHPDEIVRLRHNMKAAAEKAENPPGVHIHHRDGFEALRALTPPETKRGAVFCDPSYEDASDYEKAAQALIGTHRRWAGAALALWYPLVAVKKAELGAMKRKIIDGIKNGKAEKGILDALLCVNTENSHRESALKDVNRSEPPRLYGSGMIVVNPPWKLGEELAAVLPALARSLGIHGAGSYEINNY